MTKAAHKQPKGFSVFFLTEMWERYGFYTIQGLLVFFLIAVFKYQDKHSYEVLGSLTALAYTMPVIGGYLADNYLGYRHAITAGGILMMLGFFCLSFNHSETLFFYFISFVSVGTGLLKPNVSSLLGSLYEHRDPRRDAGYTLFYVGLNFGIIGASIFSGILKQQYGWNAAFFAAGVGLLMGTVTFIYGMFFRGVKCVDDVELHLPKIVLCYLLIAVLVAVCAYLLQHNHAAQIAFVSVFIISIAAILILNFIQSPKFFFKACAYVLLIVVSVVFWSIFFQQFTSLNLLIERAVDRNLFGHEIPTTIYYGVEAFSAILFGPVFSMVWYKLAKAKIRVPDAIKFSIGMLWITISFGILALGVFFHGPTGLVNSFWIVLAYLMVGFADLSLSPIGLSMTTKLASPKFVGFMMGVFLFSIGLGGKLAGFLATIADIPAHTTSLITIDHIYQHALDEYFVIALIGTVFAFAVSPIIIKLSRRPGLGV